MSLRRLGLAILAFGFIASCSSDPVGNDDRTAMTPTLPAPAARTPVASDVDETPTERRPGDRTPLDAGASDAAMTERDADTSHADAGSMTMNDAGMPTDAGSATCAAPGSRPVPRCANGVDLYNFEESVIVPGNTAISNARVRIDEAGFVHAAYVKRIVPVHIEYATQRPGGWLVETVAAPTTDPDSRVTRSRLAMGPCRTPFIAYQRGDRISADLYSMQAWLARRSGATWIEELIPVPTSATDSTPSRDVRYVDMASNDAGEMIVAATAGTTTHILKRTTAGSWSSEPLPFSPGTEVVMALHPRIGVVLGYGRMPRIAWKEAGTWKESLVPGARPINDFSVNDKPEIGLAVDAAGNALMGWGAKETDSSESLYVSRWTAGAWSVPEKHANASGWAAQNLDLWFSASQVPYVNFETYKSLGKVIPLWSSGEDDAWVTQGVMTASTGLSGSAVGMTDDADRLHLLVADGTGLRLRYQACVTCSGGFCPQTVAAAGAVGQKLSMAVDSTGSPVIAFTDFSKGLRVARSTASGWKRETVMTGSIGDASIALDAMNNPQVSFWDITAHALKIARWKAGAWDISTVDASAEVGGFNKLALDAAGNAHISYFDSSNLDLKYASWTGTTWNIETVDAAGDVGRFSDLRLDSHGYARITYIDFGPRNLKYAAWDGTRWNIETIDAASTANATALALDASDKPRIAYYDAGSTNDLKYAAWDGTRWGIETIVSAGDVGYAPAITVNAAGTHIVFSDFAKSVRYVRSNGAGWTDVTVEKTAEVSSANAIASDGAGHLHFAYQDAYNSDIKYTRAP